jgi:hypothetical protein
VVKTIISLAVLVAAFVVLVRQASDEVNATQPPPVAVAAPVVPVLAPTRLAQSSPSTPEAPTELKVIDAGPWPNTEVVNQLRDVDSTAASVRAAIAKARPVLGHDQDVQLLVGDLLIGHGDIVDGLAWLLLACQDCTQADERIGYGCAAEGLCDPNLAYIDVLRRDFGEQAVADALVRTEEIKAAIANKESLAPFTEVSDKRFPRDVGECVQLRTPTPECPPEEILRQTREAYE